MTKHFESSIEIGKFLQRERRLRGLSQREATEALTSTISISPSQLSKMEQGELLDSREKVASLANHYGFSDIEFQERAHAVCGMHYSNELKKLRELPYNMEPFTIEGEFMRILFTPKLSGIDRFNCPEEALPFLSELQRCNIRQCLSVLWAILDTIIKAKPRGEFSTTFTLAELDSCMKYRYEFRNMRPKERLHLIHAAVLSLINTTVTIYHGGVISTGTLLKAEWYTGESLKKNVYDYCGIIDRLLDEWELYYISVIADGDRLPREVYNTGSILQGREVWQEVVDRQICATITFGASLHLYEKSREEGIRAIYSLNGKNPDLHSCFVEASTDTERMLCNGQEYIICSLAVKELQSYIDRRRTESKDKEFFLSILTEYICVKYKGCLKGCIRTLTPDGEFCLLVLLTHPFIPFIKN